MSQQNYAEALRIADSALSLMNAAAAKRAPAKKGAQTVRLPDGGERAALMIAVAKAYAAQGMRAEAEKAMADAERELAGSLEEGNVAVGFPKMICLFSY